MTVIAGILTDNAAVATTSSGQSASYRILVDVAGTATHADVFCTNTAGITVGIYEDSAGTPTNLIAEGTVTPTAAGINQIELNPKPVLALGQTIHITFKRSTATSVGVGADSTLLQSRQRGTDPNGATMADPFSTLFSRADNPAISFQVLDLLPSGPSLDTPTSVTGDDPTLTFTGTQLSTTALTVRAEFSLDDFSTIKGFIDYDLVAPSNGTTFDAIFKNGFEESLGSTASGFKYLPFTDGAYKCRWIFLDDTESPIPPLEFDSLDNPNWVTGTGVNGYSHHEFDASEATTDTDSILQRIKSSLPTDVPCQMTMPNSVTNELGGVVTFNFADPDHPLPNQYGGDTEALQATYIATAAVTTSNGEAWSQQVTVTPAP